MIKVALLTIEQKDLLIGKEFDIVEPYRDWETDRKSVV